MSEPRILIFDLETLPDLKQAMRVFPQLSDYEGRTLKASINSIIVFGYKWLNEPVKTICVWDKKRDINDDYDLCKKAREILLEADLVVGHNSKKFDWKMIQSRLMINGLQPLPHIQHFDTCQAARRHLNLFSNRLDSLGELVNDKKIKTGGWELWTKVLQGNKNAQKKMAEYCAQDVTLTEKVFKKLRPFVKELNHNLFTAGKRKLCPTCGSSRLISNGYRSNKTKRFMRLRCLDCGSCSQLLLSGQVKPL